MATSCSTWLIWRRRWFARVSVSDLPTSETVDVSLSTFTASNTLSSTPLRATRSTLTTLFIQNPHTFVKAFAWYPANAWPSPKKMVTLPPMRTFKNPAILKGTRLLQNRNILANALGDKSSRTKTRNGSVENSFSWGSLSVFAAWFMLDYGVPAKPVS